MALTSHLKASKESNFKSETISVVEQYPSLYPNYYAFDDKGVRTRVYADATGLLPEGCEAEPCTVLRFKVLNGMDAQGNPVFSPETFDKAVENRHIVNPMETIDAFKGNIARVKYAEIAIQQDVPGANLKKGDIIVVFTEVRYTVNNLEVLTKLNR